jgi:nucleotide-binding universal stress UspA family protein
VAVAKGLGLSVLVLGVLDWPPVDILREEDTYRKRYTAYLDDVVKRIRKQGAQAVTELKTGRAADQILASIAESEARFIVMSTHGRSGEQRC